MKRLIVLLFLVIALTSCKSDKSPVNASEGISQVNWVEINSPPDEDGPCYAFFFSNFSGAYHGYGYAGVWCK